MCGHHNFVRGVRDRRRVRLICDCREVRGDRNHHHHHHHSDCGCGHRRRRDVRLICECREFD